MAQTSYAIVYIGAMNAKRDTSYSTADILTLFPTATVVKMKTEGVKASVNDTDYFDVGFDDETFLDTGHTYKFTKDCVIAIGIYKAVV